MQNYAPTNSTAISVTENQNNATLTLTAKPQQTVPGQAFNLTATAASTTTGVPCSSATFFNAANQSLGTVQLVNGAATLSQTLTQLGSTSYTANYSGDSDFTATTSQPVTVTVKQLPSSTTIASNPNSGTFGSGTYSVSSSITSTGGGVPTGTVTYKDISSTIPTTLGTVNVSAGGTAMLANISLTGGTHTIVAYYLQSHEPAPGPGSQTSCIPLIAKDKDAMNGPPSLIRHYAATNFIAAEFMQYRSPVGAGPSGNTCPRCPSHRAHLTSVRSAPRLISVAFTTFS